MRILTWAVEKSHEKQCNVTMGTYHLAIVGVVSAGVAPSPGVEVWQSGHGALEVVLFHPGAEIGAPGDDDGVL